MEKFIKPQPAIASTISPLTPVKKFIVDNSEDFVTLDEMAEAINCTTGNIRQHLSQLRIKHGVDHEIRGGKDDREFKTWIR